MISPKELQFVLIVNEPSVAAYVAAVGINRLFVDLEHMGKETRQGGLDTWKSRQTIEDVTRIRIAAPLAHLMVRINPLHGKTSDEVQDVIDRGANSIMLPMFRSMGEFRQFATIVGGRVEMVALVETRGALAAVPTLVREFNSLRVHIGLNDLHLDFGMDFLFEPLADGLLEEPAREMRAHGVGFGIGGIARAGQGLVSPEFLLGEHVRLGSDAVILSRAMHQGASSVAALKAFGFEAEIERLRLIYTRFQTMSLEALNENRLATISRIKQATADSRIRRMKARSPD